MATWTNPWGFQFATWSDQQNTHQPQPDHRGFGWMLHCKAESSGSWSTMILGWLESTLINLYFKRFAMVRPVPTARNPLVARRNRWKPASSQLYINIGSGLIPVLSKTMTDHCHHQHTSTIFGHDQPLQLPITNRYQPWWSNANHHLHSIALLYMLGITLVSRFTHYGVSTAIRLYPKGTHHYPTNWSWFFCAGNSGYDPFSCYVFMVHFHCFVFSKCCYAKKMLIDSVYALSTPCSIES